MTVLLSLLAAASYGLGDFNGGIFSKRGGPWAVSLVAQLVGTAFVLVVALVDGGDPTGSDLLWALLAGVGNGFGTAFLYRGPRLGPDGRGRPGLGRRRRAGAGRRRRRSPASGPGALVWLGIVLALPAIWLVSREPADGRGRPSPRGSGLARRRPGRARLRRPVRRAGADPGGGRLPAPGAQPARRRRRDRRWSRSRCGRTGCPATRWALGGVDQRRPRRPGHRAVPGRHASTATSAWRR